MSEPIISSPETRVSYCACCGEPARVGALALKGWPHAALVCARCLRELATTIELNGTPPARARVAEASD